MSSAVSPRILAAIDLLAPRPGEHLLEIGCGTGQAIQAVLERQQTARVTAIDRSHKAVARARIVNRAALEDGRAAIAVGDIEEAPVEPRNFRRAFAIRVNSFWTHPGVALPNVAASLRPGGELWMIYDDPAAKVVGPITASLENSNLRFMRAETKPGAFAIIARPAE